MNDRVYWREWPLAVFTVAVQLACGLAFAATILDWQTRPGKEPLAKDLALLVFPVVAVGLLASVLHLGRPLSSWRAFTNARRSRLSQEVVVVSAFALDALVYGAMWWNGVAAGARFACGLSTGTLGLVAVLATANVYRIPTRTSWRSVWMPVSFLGTVLLLGGLAPLLRDGIQPSMFIASTLAGSGAVVLSVVLMSREHFKAHASGFDRERMKPKPTEWILTAVYLVSASVGPAVFLIVRSQIPVLSNISWILYPAFALVVAGVTLGRTTMFAMEPDPCA